jgi:hypothetical protein
MRWAGHLACVGERRGLYGFWWGNLMERDHLEDPDVDGRIIVRWIFRKWDMGAWTGSIWFRIGTGGGECSNETWGSLKCEEFLDWQRTCWLLKKSSAPRTKYVS